MENMRKYIDRKKNKFRSTNIKSVGFEVWLIYLPNDTNSSLLFSNFSFPSICDKLKYTHQSVNLFYFRTNFYREII